MADPDFENMSDDEVMNLSSGNGADDISAALNGEDFGPDEPVNPEGDSPEIEEPEVQAAPAPETDPGPAPDAVGSEEDDPAPAEGVKDDEPASSPADPEEPADEKFSLDVPDEGTLEEQIDAAAAAAAEAPKDPEDPEAGKSTESQAGEESTAQDPVTSEGNDQPPVTDPPEATPEAKPTGEADGAEGDAPDYEKLYQQITAPFKANGKTIEIRDPKDAIQLMQQGANYVKKMSALKPNLKMMRMLENNGLLDETKIGLFIDVMSGDKEAVQKVIKDNGIDPLDIDTQSESQYKPGNHQVSDAEMAFSSTLEDVMSSDNGKETVSVIEKTWDNQSQAEVYKDPDLLPLMHAHRQSGIYQKIAGEIDRQRILGQISESVSFLDAYKAVGDQLHQKGQLLPPEAQQTAPPAPAEPAPAPAPAPAQKQPIARTPAPSRRNTAVNGDRAAAASPTRSTTSPPRKAVKFDPFEMTDEEIAKATRPII